MLRTVSEWEKELAQPVVPPDVPKAIFIFSPVPEEVNYPVKASLENLCATHKDNDRCHGYWCEEMGSVKNLIFF